MVRIATEGIDRCVVSAGFVEGVDSLICIVTLSRNDDNNGQVKIKQKISPHDRVREVRSLSVLMMGK